MGQQVSPPQGAAPAAATPPDGQQPAAPAAPINGAAQGGQQQDPFAGISHEGKSPEQIEAEYRARLGGHQRGWNAAEAALRAENETLRQRLEQQALGGMQPGSNGASGQPGGQQVPDASQQLVTQLREQVAQAERAKTIAERRAKFPSLSSEFVDDSIFATLDDADLTKLAARLETNVSGGFIAPTAPRRTAAPPAQAKPIHERTKEELLADLERLAPIVHEQERQRLGQ